MRMKLALVSMLVTVILSRRVYEARDYQHTTTSRQLDTFINTLDRVGGQLKSLNAQYQALSTRGGEYTGSGNEAEFVEADVEMLMGAAGPGATWDDNSGKCRWAEFDSREDRYQGQPVNIKSVFCPDTNTFLTAIEYSNENGMLVGKCCEGKKKGKGKKGGR